jgi:hypothetical protein
VTNQCVLVCNLQKWTDSESLIWQILPGTQDEVGRSLAAILDDSGVSRIDDFGDVAGSKYWHVTPSANNRSQTWRTK